MPSCLFGRPILPGLIRRKSLITGEKAAYQAGLLHAETATNDRPNVRRSLGVLPTLDRA
jgi:hypothetical protein